MPHRARDLEARLQRAEQQLRLLQRMSRLMVRDVQVTQVLEEVVSLVKDFMHSDSCLVYLCDGDRLVLCASSEPEAASAGAVSLTLNEGLTGWVARERRLLAISREAYQDSRFKYFKNLPQDTFEAFLSVPIIWHSQVLGVINVQHQDPHSHSGDELEALTTVGEQLGCLLTLSLLRPGTVNLTHVADLVLAAK